MKLPQALSAALRAVDEDYLIALCNKGAVNRAKKDLSPPAARSRSGLGELDRLAILRPRRGERQEYDRVEQRFTLRLLDGVGWGIWLTVRYRERSQAVVEAPEKLTDQWEQDPNLRPVFFGALYREEGRLCLYPIECFTSWEGTP